ncbi:MAG: YceI family protein [Vampirovibrio sp.]|nr:YceI family protein [Vampirovibrio sp.]
MKSLNIVSLAVTLLLGGSLIYAPASFAKTLHFKVTGGGDDKVAFTSDAPVEVIHGTTNQVTGEVMFDDSFKFDAAHPFKINFAVDLNSIDTGIDLRNEHMRDNFLETAKYSKAVYKATGIKLTKKVNLSKPQTVKLVSTGDFTLHGVTTKKTIPLTVDYKPATGKTLAKIRVRGKFPVPLAQHQIKRPEAVFVKLAETVYVDVDLVGAAQQ